MNQEWANQHRAINDLSAYLDKTLPNLTLESTSANVFAGTAALYRCNRLLQAVDHAVEGGFGDTAGGNVRTLYETWVFGHLMMLSDAAETRQIIAMTRGQAGRIIKAMDLTGQVDYPDAIPEPAGDIGIRQRAEALGKKLSIDDPAHAEMPVLCYDYIFRPESHLSAHANLDVMSQYITQTSDTEATVGVNNQAEDCRHRTQYAAYITAYFGSQVLQKAGVEMTQFADIEYRLATGVRTIG